MKKRKLFLLPLVLFAMSISACHGANSNSGNTDNGGQTQPSGGDENQTPTDTTVAVNSVSLNFETLTLTVDETKQLTATVLPENATDKAVTWETSNSAIATVVSGLVTAKAQGNATITAKAGGKSATCSVVVNPKQQGGGEGEQKNLTGITVSGNKEEYHVGDNLDDLVVTAHFSDNTEVVIPKADYTVSGFDSSAPAQNVVVTISYGGQTATFTCNIVAAPITYYTVSFDLNGGSGSILSVQVAEGGTFTFPNPSELTSFGAPEGYHFVKWLVGTAEYDPGQTMVINANTVVKAKWEQNQVQPPVNYYTITYKPGEGTGAEISFENIEEGTVITLRNNPFGAPVGKEFKSWLIEGTEYAEGASYTLNGDVDAVAQWETIPTKSYTLVMVDGENETTEDLTVNTSAGTNIETGEPVEYKIQDVELAKGQQFMFQLARDDWRGWSQVKISDKANKDFEEGDLYNKDHLIKVKQAGHYNFWIKTTPETTGSHIGKSIWIEENFHFIAVKGEYNGLIMPGGHFDESKVVVTLTYEDNSEWNNVPTSLCTFEENDEKITGETVFTAGEHEITVWCANLQSTFKIEVAQYENFIRYRHLDNWHDVELKENPSDANELYIENGIELAAEDEFVLYADGAWRHFEDLESGVTGFDDLNGDIKVTTSDTYDIYFKLDSSKIWIGSHVNYCAVHFLPGMATGTMQDQAVPEGSEITLPTGNGHFVISNYKFIGWKIQGEDILYKEGDKLTIDGETTLVAQWEELDDNWYLFGEFNNWEEKDANYLLEKGTKTDSEEGNGVHAKKEGYDQYFINGVVLEKDQEFKFEQGNMDEYIPFDENIKVDKSGTYNIYVCPDAVYNSGIFEWGGYSYHLHRTDVVTYTIVGISSWEVDDSTFTLSHRTVAGKEQVYYEGLYLGKDQGFKIVLDAAWDGALDFSNLSTATKDSGNFSEEDTTYHNIKTENAGYYDIVVDVESGEISITAQMVNVKFKANDEQVTPDVVQVHRGTQYTLPANTYPVPSGYRFAGWSDGSAIVQPGNTYQIDEEITFTAFFIQVFTVSFDANGGTGTIDSVTKDADTSLTLPACTFTAPSGQQFKCWKVGDDEYSVGDSLYVDDNKVVKAIWEDIPTTKYDVTFNANGGTGTMAPVETAGTYVLPANGFTAPANKQFKCWEVNGAELNPGHSITVDDDIEIIAVWIDIFTVSFAANGGTGTMSPVNKLDGEEYILPECGFTAPEGKKFAGWLINTDEYNVGDTITVDTNITVTAKWANKQYSLQINYFDVDLVDDSANKPDGAFAQYKATVDHIDAGSVITFAYDGNPILPTTSGTGNNASVEGDVLVAYEGGDNLDLYLKVFKDEHGALTYDVWFFGFQYYLIGDFNGWTQRDSEYKLTVDPLDSNHYTMTGVELSKNTELKVFSSKQEWFGDGNNQNLVVGANGVYTIDFYVSVNEGVSHINLTKTGEYDPGDVVYYLVGDFNSWTQKDNNYKLTLVGENHYQIAGVVLNADNMKMKVIGAEGSTLHWYRNNSTYTNCGYTIGESPDYNIVVTAAGTYTIDFYTDNLGGNPVTFTKTA